MSALRPAPAKAGAGGIKPAPARAQLKERKYDMEQVLNGKMRAVTVFGVGDVGVREYDIPQPRGGEVLIKMKGASICTLDQRAYTGATKGKFPVVSGHEGFGVIAAVGDGVQGLKVGDTVIAGRSGCGVCSNCKTKGIGCVMPNGRGVWNESLGIYGSFGCMSEYTVKSAIHVTKIKADPNSLKYAITEPVSCVVRSVTRSRLTWSESCVIIGAGVMGLLHVQLAKLKGALVIVSETDAVRRQKALDAGADYVVDPNETDLVEFVKRVTEEGKGADVVFSTLPIAKLFPQNFAMVSKMGRIVAYSNLVPAEPVPIDIAAVHKNEYEIIGTNGSSIQDIYYAAKLIEQDKVDLDPLIDSVYSINDCKKAYERACAPDSYRCVFDFSL